MNRHDEQQLSAQYRQMPRVESPGHLDERILGAARKGVPEKRSSTANSWFPALATACVAGAVFYIATPLFEAPSYQPPAVEATLSDVSVQEEADEAGAVDATSVEITASPAKPAAATLDHKQKKAETTLQVQTAKQIDHENKVKKMQKGQLSSVRESVQSAQGTSAAAESRATAQVESMEKGLGANTASLFQDDQQAVVERKRIARLTPAEVAQRIERITALANDALTEDAQRLLDDLIAQCPECELPKSLAALQASINKVKENKPASFE